MTSRIGDIFLHIVADISVMVAGLGSGSPPPGTGHWCGHGGDRAAQHASTAALYSTVARPGLQHRGWCRDPASAPKSSIRRFVITEKAPTRAFSWLKAATAAFTFKTLLRHYALIPRSLNMKLGSRRKGHKGRAVWLA